jgi:hypothetical protein
MRRSLMLWSNIPSTVCELWLRIRVMCLLNEQQGRWELLHAAELMHCHVGLTPGPQLRYHASHAQKLNLMREDWYFTYSSTLPLTCSSRRAQMRNRSWLHFILINHVCQDSNSKPHLWCHARRAPSASPTIKLRSYGRGGGGGALMIWSNTNECYNMPRVLYRNIY